MEEDIRIAVFDGIDKKSFKDNKEYDGIEAMRILGACERKTLTCTYVKEILVPEEWMEDPVFPGYWEPEHWAPCQGTEFDEKYDVLPEYQDQAGEWKKLRSALMKHAISSSASMMRKEGKTFRVIYPAREDTVRQ